MRRNSPVSTLTILLSIGLDPFSLNSALARWARPEEANANVVLARHTYDVQDSGSYFETVERDIRILNDAGRSRYGTLRIGYDATVSKFNLIEAWVETHGKLQRVSPGNIEDLPTGGSTSGFDKSHEVTIAFPNVEVGSLLHFKYRFEVTERGFPGHFSEVIFPGLLESTERFVVEVLSDKELFIDSRDERGALEVTRDRSGSKYRIKVENVRPLTFEIKDEEDVFIDPATLPRVMVSTDSNWKRLAEHIVPKYEAVIKQDLPELHRAIANKTRGIPTLVDRINRITEVLAERIRYHGDWRTREAAVVPRNLLEIADLQFGDCKDIATSLVAILRNQGTRAYVALVYRGERFRPFEPEIAMLGEFNHAIVYVPFGDSGLWVDPTNSQSFAQGIFEDIANRRSLVLDPENTRFLRIPQGKPEDEASESERTEVINDAQRRSIDFELRLKNRAASFIVGKGLGEASQEEVETLIASNWVNKSEIIAVAIPQIRALKERTLRDLVIKGRIVAKNADSRSSAGWVRDISSSTPFSDLKLNERVSSFWLGSVSSRRRLHKLRSIRLIGAIPRNCEVKTQWFESSRKFKALVDGLAIDEKWITKESVIPVRDLNSPKFKRALVKLDSCTRRVSVLYELLRDPKERDFTDR